MLQNTLQYKLDSLNQQENINNLRESQQKIGQQLNSLELKLNIVSASLVRLTSSSSGKLNAILETLSVQKAFNQTAIKKVNYKNKSILFKYRVVSQVDFLDILNENFNNKRIGIVTEHQKNTHAYDINNYNFQEGDVVIDIGANIGMYSIKLLQHFPFLKIYAFEPVLENFELLCENIRLNNLESNIIPINKAVYSHSNGVYMQYLPFYPAGSSADSFLIEKRNSLQYYSVLSEKPVLIESLTLDDIFTEYKISKCKLVKMDCEGAEKEIIYNTKVLSKFEYFVVELHFSETENNEIIQYLQQFFAADKLFVEELNHYQAEKVK